MDVMNKMQTFLHPEATRCLAAFLEEILPTLPKEKDWWNELVVNKLSYSQKNAIESYNKSSLADLDLAALLHVLDKNWHKMSQKQNRIHVKGMNIIKEMREIRNRWAHSGFMRFSNENVYLDMHTL